MDRHGHHVDVHADTDLPGRLLHRVRGIRHCGEYCGQEPGCRRAAPSRAADVFEAWTRLGQQLARVCGTVDDSSPARLHEVWRVVQDERAVYNPILAWLAHVDTNDVFLTENG